MEIRFSRYNLPFCEPSSAEIHYISLDDQCDMRAGRYNAHVAAYRAANQSRLVEVFNPLTGVTAIHELSGQAYFRPFANSPDYFLSPDELDFLRELHFEHGLRSAAVRTSQFFRADS